MTAEDAMKSRYPKWKVHMLELENGAWDIPCAVQESAGFAVSEIERLSLRLDALEFALSELLETAVPRTPEEWDEYHASAEYAETVLRGGIPEGERKLEKNLD